MSTWFPELDKIFVIDSDTLVTGDIAPIWDVDISGKLIGAVPEVAMYGKYNNLEDPMILRSVPLYFNMGMCLINLREWREREVSRRIKECVDRDNPVLRIADQSLLNLYLNSEIVRIDLKYNYYSTVHGIGFDTLRTVFPEKDVFGKAEFEAAKADHAIIHYFGHSFERPWFKHNAAFRKEEYLKVRQETPWATQPLQRWTKPQSRILRVYDIASFVLLKLGMRSVCLKFRYVYGQRLKGITKIHR